MNNDLFIFDKQIIITILFELIVQDFWHNIEKF